MNKDKLLSCRIFPLAILLFFLIIGCSKSGGDPAPAVDSPSTIVISTTPGSLKPFQDMTIAGTVTDPDGILQIKRSIMQEGKTAFDDFTTQLAGVSSYQYNETYNISYNLEPGNYKVKISVVDSKNNTVSMEQAFQIAEDIVINMKSPVAGQVMRNSYQYPQDIDVFSNAGISTIAMTVVIPAVPPVYLAGIGPIDSTCPLCSGVPLRYKHVTLDIVVNSNVNSPTEATYKIEVTSITGVIFNKSILVMVSQ